MIDILLCIAALCLIAIIIIRESEHKEEIKEIKQLYYKEGFKKGLTVKACKMVYADKAD